jgi:hypothetical protein
MRGKPLYDTAGYKTESRESLTEFINELEY